MRFHTRDDLDPVVLMRRLDATIAALERTRAERDQAIAALYAVRRYLVEGWPPMSLADLLEHFVDPVLALVSGHHPAAG